MRELSKTRFERFYACPFTFFCAYILKLPAERNDALERGNAVHDCIAEYALHCKEKNLETDFNYVGQLVSDVLCKLRISSDVFEEAYELVNEFASSHIFIPGRIIAVEKWIEFPVGQYLYRGKVDFGEYEKETKTLIVTDYKTSHVIDSKEAVAKDLSLLGYATGLIDNLKLDVENVVKRLDFVRFSHVVEAESSAKECIKEAFKRIQIGGDLIAEYERKNEWKATPGNFCDWCGYSLKCPHDDTDIPKIRTLKEAKLIAGEILAMERRTTVKNSNLKNFCAVAGPVEVNGVKFGFEEKESFNFVDDKLIEFAEKIGKSVPEVVKSKEYYRKDLELEGALVVGKKTQWSHIKIKD